MFRAKMTVMIVSLMERRGPISPFLPLFSTWILVKCIVYCNLSLISDMKMTAWLKNGIILDWSTKIWKILLDWKLRLKEMIYTSVRFDSCYKLIPISDSRLSYINPVAFSIIYMHTCHLIYVQSSSVALKLVYLWNHS